MAVKQGAAYDLSLFARGGDGFTGPLTVPLESQDGMVYAAGRRARSLTDAVEAVSALPYRQRHRPAGRGWSSAPRKPGMFWLDMVSLFPQKTWKGRPTVCGRTWPRCSPA